MSSGSELHDYIRILLESSNWSIQNLTDRFCLKEHKNYHNINAIITSWSALEAFVNLILVISRPAPKLESHEVAFLEEKEWKLKDDGEFECVKAYQSTAKKILFILNRFSDHRAKKFKQQVLWNNLKRAEEYRNNLIHPKGKITARDYGSKASIFVNETVRDVIKFLNTKTLKIRRLPYPV